MGKPKALREDVNVSHIGNGHIGHGILDDMHKRHHHNKGKVNC